MSLKQYEIGFEYLLPEHRESQGIFYDMIFAPNTKIARETMHKIYGKNEIKIVSVQDTDEAYPSVKNTAATGKF